jgi:hypothetical protein
MNEIPNIELKGIMLRMINEIKEDRLIPRWRLQGGSRKHAS